MNCQKWRQLISSARDRQLNNDETLRLQDHLSSCSDCQEAWQWQQLAGKAMNELSLSEAPSDFNQAIWDKIDNVSAVAPSRWHRWSLPFGALALTAVAAAMVMITFEPFHIEEKPDIQTALVQKTEQAQQVIRKVTAPEPTEIVAQEQEVVIAKEESIQAKQVIAQEQILEPSPEKEAVSEAPIVPKGPEREKPKVAKKYRGPRRIPGKAFTTSKPDEVEESTVVSAAADTQPDTSQQALELEPRDMRIMNNKIHINRNEQTRLEFQLDQAGLVHIKIFSRTGRLVKTLQEGELSAGLHSFSWDGKTQTGEFVASGIYVMMISGDLKMQKFKIAVIK